MAFKPHRAVDVDLEKQKFPVCILPKIDGVRGLNEGGNFTSRTLKPFGNRHTNSLFRGDEFAGFDGELAAGNDTDADLCRKTTSATSSHEGEPNLTWHIFDLCAVSVAHLGFKKRWEMARDYLTQAHEQGQLLDLQIVPMYVVNNMEEFLEWEQTWLDMGYEGLIARDPEGKYKHGTATVREGAYLRLKRFIEEDAIVVSIKEGESNGNEAQINELGQTFRTTHQENMTPNGMVGTIICQDVKTGKEIFCGPGAMTHEDRYKYFANQELIIGQVIKYKHFPKGVKDRLRFAQFVSFRSPEDFAK